MATEPNPYVGPRPFETDDAERFFGRAREIRDLTALVVSHRVVLVYSASGAGKSSLLNAGVAPALAARGFQVLPAARIGAPVRAGEADNVFTASLVAQWAGREEAPPATSLAAFLAGLPRGLDEDGHPQPRVGILDQFEELFTTYPERWTQRPGLFDQLREALEQDDRFRVVLALREEYLAQLEPYAQLLPGSLRARFRLERLDHASALAAVTGPLADTTRSFAPEAADELVRNLRKLHVETGGGQTLEVEGEYVEPVQLQVVCRELWTRLGADVREITSRHLRELADLDTVLARFYEEALAAAMTEAKVRERGLRSWVTEELITPGGTRSIVYRGKSETGGMPNRAVDELERKRLVRAEDRAGARWYELTHDRLIAPIRSSNARFFAVRRKRRMRAAALALVLLAAAAAAALASTRPSSSGDGPVVPPTLAPSRLDFGSRSDPVDFQQLTLPLTLSSGSETQRIVISESGDTKDFSFRRKDCPETIERGRGCSITVRFNPTDRGARVAQLEVRTNRHRLEATLRGTLVGHCGIERWPVKTLSDRDAANIALAARATTIAALTRLPAPGERSGARIPPVEFATYRVEAKLVAMSLPKDNDIRLLIADPKTGATMAAELPAAACALDASTDLRAQMRQARRTLTSVCGGPPPKGRFKALKGTASIVGVGFFDHRHGARGEAPNGIELHPVLAFAADCGPDLAVTHLAAEVHGQSVRVNASVTNFGSPSRATHVEVSAPGFTGSRLPVPALPRGGSVTLRAVLTIPASAQGRLVSFYATVDPENAVKEAIERNNVRATKVLVPSSG